MTVVREVVNDMEFDQIRLQERAERHVSMVVFLYRSSLLETSFSPPTASPDISPAQMLRSGVRLRTVHLHSALRSCLPHISAPVALWLLLIIIHSPTPFLLSH